MGWLDMISGEYGFTLAAALYAYTALASPLAGVNAAAASLLASVLWGLTYSLTILYKTLAAGPIALFSGSLVFDSFSALLLTAAHIALLTAMIGLWGLVNRWRAGEAVYAAIGLMALGILVLASAANLEMVYAAWILSAIMSYVLIALKKDSISAEAAVKYAATGAAATIVLLLGITLAYYNYYSSLGLSASPAVAANPWLIAAALAFIVSAAGFKIGVFPFQMWMPDVYGSADPSIISVVASLAKIITILILLKLLAPIASLEPHMYLAILGFFAVITMFYGNIGAFNTIRDSPQKTLAYSSIAQAGYLVAGLAALAALPGADAKTALAGLAIHTFAYVLAKLAAFQTLSAAGCEGGECSWERLRGLARRSPAVGFSIAVAMASLAGIPVTLGFWGKLYIFLAVARVNSGLAALMLVNFAMAVFYYGYIIYQVALVEPVKGVEVRVRGNSDLAAFAAAVLTLLLGVVGWMFYGVSLYPYA
jgi:NADH-quinone oxidoreductase subunit N